MTVAHPLDPLSETEIGAVVRILREGGHAPPSACFSDVELIEPAKGDMSPGTSPHRLVRACLVTGPASTVQEVVVDLTEGAVSSSREVSGVCPTILLGETINATVAVRADSRWREAMSRRGITDFDQVEIDAWPAGRFGLAWEDGRRLARCTSYLKEQETDSMYARPIDGVLAFVDLGSSEVLGVEDHGVAPVPPRGGGFRVDDVGELRRDLRPIEIRQPDGPSFEIDGYQVRWQRWSFRLGIDSHEGLVLHSLGYEDDGRVRPILHRASVTEMVVPYGDPGPMHGWKNAFDASEWGLGKVANSLEQGCDCLGEIRYFDASFAGERGDPYTIKNAVCLHEEDYGVGWKHVDLGAGVSEVRRSRRLVISSFVTAGNYDYGFYWYLYLDGTIELEVKLTGIVSTVAAAPGTKVSHAERVTAHLAAPHHQHLFSARLDFDLDGEANSVYEVDVERDDWSAQNPWGCAFATHPVLLESEGMAQRNSDPSRNRTWKVVNRERRNACGEPVGYRLVPRASPVLLAQPGSSIAKRAGFATHSLWVTPYDPEERRAAGEYPNQHLGGDGLVRWTRADRPIVDTDIVLWHTFGVTHVVRPEDYPVMPVEYCGFSLVPVGFFDANPALDVPPAGCE